jgi:hypothetical protein
MAMEGFMHRPPSRRYFSAYGALYGSGNAEVAGKKRSCSHAKPRRIEQGLQIKLVAWALALDLPLISIPNAGKRSLQDGSIQKALGLRKGVSDLFLAKPSRGFGGYWIEMKAPGKKPRPEQYQWLDEMRANGYKAEWFDDWEKARESIIDYLKG